MPRSVRLIVVVDEDKCVGCGRCIEACLTGALQIVNGKSKLVDERRCDGFGSCIAVCLNNAIRLEMREAEEFDWSILNEMTYDKLIKKLERASAPII
ncbi:MAG: 4Fe-4S binding protein [Candidatus Bathyarchaeia archaeon]|nr:4Fe-4S binding protein [Candidatus Bathyarchaeota archaeon]